MERIIGIIEKKTTEVSRKELEDKINTFYHLAANLKQGREDIAYLLKKELDTLCLNVDEMIERMASDVNRNCNRIRYDLRSWIHTTIDHYSQQMKGIENLLIAEIEQAMQIKIVTV